MTKDEMFFRVNEATEPLNALKMLKEFLTEAEDEEYYLKWAIIAAHSTLQGFMVLALRGTSSIQIVKKHKKDKNKTAFEILSNPEKQLDNFLHLFNKIKDEQYMPNGAFVDKSGEITESIENLNEIRNQFIHYFPCSWTIGISTIYRILENVIIVIDFLTQSCLEYSCCYTDLELRKIGEVIEECKLLIKS